VADSMLGKGDEPSSAMEENDSGLVRYSINRLVVVIVFVGVMLALGESWAGAEGHFPAWGLLLILTGVIGGATLVLVGRRYRSS